MRTSSDVVVYETKPATEWLFGGPVQKVSPKFNHALIQGHLYSSLAAWARGRGRVGIEWRFWLEPPGESSRYLVPDVAYLSYDRLGREARDEAQEPHLAPDAAFEVLSPGDGRGPVEHKIDVYLRAGAGLVAVIDPAERIVRMVDSHANRILTQHEIFRHPSLPDFVLDLATLFATLDE